MPATVHLIDASPYIFRAHFALPASIRDPAGVQVNAVYGFASFLVKYLLDERPSHVGVAFDQNLNSSFRNASFPMYKARRVPVPSELERQLGTCEEIAGALGLATFIDPDYEADDLIATIVDRTAASGAHYVLVSVDKDLAQLVGPRVTLCDPAKGVRLDPAGVQAKFGVAPGQITDLLALAGDSVDNIPGVQGIGPKTAAELLQRYGSLEDIYANLQDLRRSSMRGARGIAGRLEQEVAMAGLSKQLATVSLAAPVHVTLDDLAYRGPHESRLDALCARLGFRTLHGRAIGRGMRAP